MSKTSLVTGGLGGIGLAISKKLLERGDDVVIFDRADQNTLLPKAKYFQVDVSSVESIKDGFTKLFNEVDKLDVLVNNAGITRDGLAMRLSEADWDSVIDVNLKGSFFCSQNAIRHMLKNRKGYIINISSIVGINGNVGQANYASSKAGLIAQTKTLAAEYGSKNICVNAIAPGFIQTKMTDKLADNIKDKILERISLKRFGNVDDIANIILFLTSGNADYITGSVINVDGGIF